jgi:hypothetical protein
MNSEAVGSFADVQTQQQLVKYGKIYENSEISSYLLGNWGFVN